MQAMALVRKAMVTGVTGSRPGSALARQQLSAEVEEAEELSEKELSEQEDMEVEAVRSHNNVLEHLIFNDTFEKEIERVLCLEGAISIRMAERSVAPSELVALLRADVSDRGTV